MHIQEKMCLWSGISVFPRKNSHTPDSGSQTLLFSIVDSSFNHTENYLLFKSNYYKKIICNICHKKPSHQ